MHARRWISLALAFSAGLLMLPSCKREANKAMGHEGKANAAAMPPPPISTNAPPAEAAAPAATNAPSGTFAFTFSDLGKALRNPEGEYVLPGSLTRADGKTTQVNGFMVPYDSLEDLSTFMLMESSGGCFFCEPPSLSQVVIVHQKAGASKSFVEEPIQVSGTFRTWAKDSTHADHQSGFLYVIDDATVTKMPWPDGKPQARPAAGEHTPGAGQ